MTKKQRLDICLTKRGLAQSRSKAQALIMAGLVRVDGEPATKAGMLVAPEQAIEVQGRDHPFVSRGGVKLKGALDHFSLDCGGLTCLDLGASTGGFTDCLLQAGAKAVTAVDVGYGQLDWKLRSDSRVTVIERVNARKLPDDVAPGPFDLITADLSFISLTLVLPRVAVRLAPGGRMLAMVKPQFEAGREAVGTGGVVKDPKVQAMAVDKVAGCLTGLGLAVLGTCPSPIKGPKGNQEFFVLAQAPPAA